jgi:hypothetical protein
VKQVSTLSSAGIVGFKAQYTFTLLPNEAAYQLMIESQKEINILMLQSTINIDLLDAEDIPAQVSFPNIDISQTTNQFLVTLKLSEPTNRVVLKIRASEGLYGSLNVFIIPQQTESKICKRLDIPILPLSLHEKVSSLPSTEDLELSSITLTGSFSQNDILNWISSCLPNVPKLNENDETKLYYKSTFIGTFLAIVLSNER